MRFSARKAWRKVIVIRTSLRRHLDLKSIFVDVEIPKDREITVLNLTQKSKNDMSAWSPDMEEERDNLTKDVNFSQSHLI